MFEKSILVSYWLSKVALTEEKFMASIKVVRNPETCSLLDEIGLFTVKERDWISILRQFSQMYQWFSYFKCKFDQ